MLKFTKDFNCCKTVSCANFGISGSESYIYNSERLGYCSTQCTLCGSHPPWINNALMQRVLSEKVEHSFAQKSLRCHTCSPYFFISTTPPSTFHGFTSAGTQRKKCGQCGAIFTQASYKNIGALKRVLHAVIEQKEIKVALQESGLSARLFYFYLTKLATILSNFSRLNEQRALHRERVAMHSEGRLLHFRHQRGIYTLLTAEVKSGYILLQTNNLTKLSLDDEHLYDEKVDTRIKNCSSDNIETVLLGRYQSHLKRNHFEQLLVGPLNPINACQALYPDTVAYVHFQLLKAFTIDVQYYEHFIEHESALRSAALLACLDEIKSDHAALYYFLPCVTHRGVKLDGKPLGWWKDRWFSNEIGAFSPITAPQKNVSVFSLTRGDAIDRFHHYLDNGMNKNVNSMQVIDNISEIYRTVYNYCVVDKDKTAACLLGVATITYQPDALLDEALKQLATL